VRAFDKPVVTARGLRYFLFQGADSYFSHLKTLHLS
jgi:hypothetical protein